MAKNTARSSRKNNRFSQIPNSSIQRSIFDRSHDYKTTMDSGYLIPFFVDEVLPGDTFKLRVNAFVRMNTLIAPFMDNVFMDTFFFFVPSVLFGTIGKNSVVSRRILEIVPTFLFLL